MFLVLVGVLNSTTPGEAFGACLGGLLIAIVGFCVLVGFWDVIKRIGG